jgi:hypothetical protein
MTAPDFARCPNRTAKCPTPSYCQPTCRHAADWLRGMGIAVQPERQPDVEDDGFVTVHCTGALQ